MSGLRRGGHRHGRLRAAVFCWIYALVCAGTSSSSTGGAGLGRNWVEECRSGSHGDARRGGDAENNCGHDANAHDPTLPDAKRFMNGYTDTVYARMWVCASEWGVGPGMVESRLEVFALCFGRPV